MEYSSCKIYFGSAGSCGNHGFCNASGHCICDTYWTSRGDFVLGYHDNCDISIIFVKVLAIIIIITCGIQACVAAYNIATFEDYKWSTLSQPKSRINLLFFVSPLGGIVYGIARLVDPINNVVGGEVASSFGYVLFFVFGGIGWALLIHIFANFLKKASRVFSTESVAKIGKMEKVTEIFWWRLAAVNWCITLFPIAAALKPSKSDSVLIAVFTVYGMIVSLTAGLLCWVLQIFNIEIGKYIKSGSASADFVLLQQRTLTLNYVGRFGFCIPFAPICILMAAWPYLRRKFTYFLMICIFTYTGPTVMVLVMLMKKRKLTTVVVQTKKVKMPSESTNKVFVLNK